VRAFLRAFGLFWYDFLIGDDWKIAAYVTAALVAVGALTVRGVLGDAAVGVVGTALLMALFVLGVTYDARKLSR
jgi:hypothetical protein